MPRRRSLFLVLLALAVGFGGGLVVAWSDTLPNPLSGRPAWAARDFRPFWEAWRLVDKEYVDREAVDRQRMMRGAIAGMIDSLGDTEHSKYLSPEEVARLEDELAGELEGIGVRVGLRRRRPTVVWVMPDSPAQKSGARTGDVLLEVDGKDVHDRPLDQIVDMVVGRAGTEVRLAVAREGRAEPVELRITRARLELPDVTWHMLPGRPVAHLAIQSFGDKADEQLRQALAGAKAAGARGLIVDVRANPGGLRDQAVAVTSEFLKGGNVFLEQDARGTRTPVPVRPGGTATEIPVVVLIDEGTASSAEIFAGSLQDHGRAKLVGAKTFGTGTVLQPFDLSDGSQVLLAVAQWLTPNGRQIWHKGVAPDVAVALSEGATLIVPEESESLTAAALAASDDLQLLKALDLLGGEMR